MHPRPRTISGGSGLFGFPEAPQSKTNPPKNVNAKTAKQAIYDNTGVGKDLRQPKSKEKNPSSAKPVFLKPAGVDDPLATKRSSSLSVLDSSAASDIIQGARRKTHSTKRERSTDTPDGEDTKLQKKKKKTKSAT